MCCSGGGEESWPYSTWLLVLGISWVVFLNRDPRLTAEHMTALWSLFAVLLHWKKESHVSSVCCTWYRNVMFYRDVLMVLRRWLYIYFFLCVTVNCLSFDLLLFLVFFYCYSWCVFLFTQRLRFRALISWLLISWSIQTGLWMIWLRWMTMMRRITTSKIAPTLMSSPPWRGAWRDFFWFPSSWWLEKEKMKERVGAKMRWDVMYRSAILSRWSYPS